MTVMPSPEELVRDVKDAIATLQNDGKGTKALAEDTKRNVEDWLQKYEAFNNDVTKKWAERERAETELKEKIAEAEKALSEAKKGGDEYKKRIEDLELKLAKRLTGKEIDGDLARETAEYKGFFGMLCKGIHPEAKGHDSYAFRPDLVEFKTLRTDTETAGGYLIPQIMDSEIRKNITEISPVRMFARVRVAPGKTMEIPRRLALPRAYYEGESEQDETGESTYGSESVTLFRQSITVPATLDMMVSSAFDLEREIASDVGEAFGLGEGVNFVKGTGSKGPQGLISDTRIEVVDTAATGVIAFGDLANLTGKLKRGQNPMWHFNRRTLAELFSIKSTIGVPIWAPVAGDRPATIWGYPYTSDMIDLDDAQDGSGTKPIMFGDMRRGYEIFDLMGISVVRDDLTKKRQAITEWTFRRYNTGRVILPEAFKIMRVKS